MFDDLRKEFAGMFGSVRPGPATRTLTVAKPFCAPARDLITATFKQYGVKVYGYDEQVKMLSPRQAMKNLSVPGDSEIRNFDPLPVAQVAKVTVSESAAAWAEYLLLRTGKLYVPGQYVNKRNADWAARHGGKMPPAGQPWIERSCSEGMKAWAPLREAAKRK
jgi:hypothetical protein